MNTEQIKERATIFKTEKIYTSITTNEDQYYNGFIFSTHDIYLMIRDRKLGKFPIMFKEIKYIVPSKQKPTEQEENEVSVI